MNYLANIQKRMKSALWPAVYLFAFFYLGFHTIQGNYGLSSLRDLRTELQSVTVVADDVRVERQALEVKVNRLRPDNLDPELLDERARAVLGYTRADEVVVFLDN